MNKTVENDNIRENEATNEQEQQQEQTAQNGENTVEDNKNSTPETPNDNPTDEQAAENANADGSEAADMPSKEQQLEAELATLQKERDEVKDKYLRMFAEFENYRRRTAKERIELQKTASASVLRDLLPVLDDFDRAKVAAGEAGLPEGVQLIQDKLLTTLSRKGLKPMDSNGKAFDAELHEAITEIPAPTDELKGKVVDTVERGYTLNDKIIRYAKVVVGK